MKTVESGIFGQVPYNLRYQKICRRCGSAYVKGANNTPGTQMQAEMGSDPYAARCLYRSELPRSHPKTLHECLHLHLIP